MKLGMVPSGVFWDGNWNRFLTTKIDGDHWGPKWLTFGATFDSRRVHRQIPPGLV